MTQGIYSMEDTLEARLNAFFDFKMGGMFVCMVAEVVNTSKLKECRIDVKPIVNHEYKDSIVVEYPTILSVPIQFPCSSTSALTFPINQGDNVLLVFSQKGLDVFKSGATSAHDPIDMRSFDKRDAIAIPCVFPFSKSINNPDTRTLIHSVGDMVMVHNIGKEDECEVRLTSGGEVKITGAHTKVSDSLTVGGSVTVGTGATGSFTTPLGQVVTVTDGIITNIF
jgi:hypothetical protein